MFSLRTAPAVAVKKRRTARAVEVSTPHRHHQSPLARYHYPPAQTFRRLTARPIHRAEASEGLLRPPPTSTAATPPRSPAGSAQPPAARGGPTQHHPRTSHGQKTHCLLCRTFEPFFEQRPSAAAAGRRVLIAPRPPGSSSSVVVHPARPALADTWWPTVLCSQLAARPVLTPPVS